MNNQLEFIVDKDSKTIFMTREFAADLDLVWDAFTKAEILELWMAPKPYRIQTKDMNFTVGGRWLYTMVSAEQPNPTRYSMQEFLEIHPKTDFTTKNTFSDEHGNSMGTAFSIVKNIFTPGAETTTVRIEKVFDDLATLEMMSTNGFKEGMAVCTDNLAEYLRSVTGK